MDGRYGDDQSMDGLCADDLKTVCRCADDQRQSVLCAVCLSGDDQSMDGLYAGDPKLVCPCADDPRQNALYADDPSTGGRYADGLKPVCRCADGSYACDRLGIRHSSMSRSVLWRRDAHHATHVLPDHDCPTARDGPACPDRQQPWVLDGALRTTRVSSSVLRRQ